MKKLIAITATAITVAGAASAMTNPGVYSTQIASFGVDASTLSQSTVDKIVRTLHGGGTENEKRQWVRSILLNVGK